MEIRVMLQKMVLQFFAIVAGTFISTVVYCSLWVPDAALTVGFLWKLLLFCVLADLPGLVYYSKKELSRKQWVRRTVWHTVLVMLVLMVAGRLFGMYQGFYGGLFFAFLILCVDAFVRVLTYANDLRTADRINQRLQERKEVRAK